MQKKESLIWVPLWVDKWIFGSTRIELSHEQRAIWIDFLALAAKDDGYIRANKETAYPLEQLAGLLCVEIDAFKAAIARFIETKKIKIEENGAIYLVNWDEYRFSERYRQRISADHDKMLKEKKKEEECASCEPLFASCENTEQNNTEQNITKQKKEMSLSQAAIDLQFKAFWAAYPKDGREAKVEAARKFSARVKEGNLAQIIRAVNNYNDFLRYEREERKFDRRAMGAKTFLHERWKEFVDLSIKSERDIGKSDRKLSAEEKAFYKARADKEAELREQGIGEKEMRDQLAAWSREYWEKKRADKR